MSDGRHPLLELTRVRLLEFFREPEAIFWIFVFVAVFGFEILGFVFLIQLFLSLSFAAVDRLVSLGLFVAAVGCSEVDSNVRQAFWNSVVGVSVQSAGVYCIVVSITVLSNGSHGVLPRSP